MKALLGSWPRSHHQSNVPVDRGAGIFTGALRQQLGEGPFLLQHERLWKRRAVGREARSAYHAGDKKCSGMHICRRVRG